MLTSFVHKTFWKISFKKINFSLWLLFKGVGVRLSLCDLIQVSVSGKVWEVIFVKKNKKSKSW